MAVAAANLPKPPTPLLGRDDELALIELALASHESRPVTLTGPPGVGKTHLAIVAAGAAAAASRFADGVLFVDLSGSRESGAFLGDIARAVGSSEAPGQPVRERLVGSLENRELLLVLDNCEQLIPMPELGTVLARCPHVQALATSRERLHLAAEREIPLSPLPVPATADVDAERVTASPAVRLLVARARAVQPDFAASAANARDLAEICIRLDGLPLALELAAAHLKAFTAGELAHRLQHRSTLLTGGLHDMPQRHHGLRTAISWSHNLMPEVERAFFRRLAVFVGGWTLPAAEVVCADPADDGKGDSRDVGQAIDATAATTSLLDKSIIRRSTGADGVTVFSMLESIREYAAEQLAEHDEVESTHRRHTAFYASLAVEAEAGIGTFNENRWWIWLGYEHGNLRSALDHSLSAGDSTAALRLAAALGWYWYTRGYVGEGRVIINRTLAVVGDAVPPVDPSAAALLTAGILAWSQGDFQVATDLLVRSRQLSDDANNDRRVAIASAFLGHTVRDAGDCDKAEVHYMRARAIHEQAGDKRGAAWADFDIAMLEWRRADLTSSARLLAESLSRFRDLGYQWAIACSAWALACVEVARGDVNKAMPHAADALGQYERIDDQRGIAQCLELAAHISHMRGLDETGGRLLGAAAVIRRALAAPGSAMERDARDRTRRAVRHALGADRAERAIRAGRVLPTSSVIALAWRVIRTGRSSADERPTAWPTARERQVAALVAAGYTNRAIGRTLGIAEKTAEVHVRNTMGKIGARSRAEIAAWAVHRGVYQPEEPEHDLPT